MKTSDYIVDFLVKRGVTDVFGVPGDVVLDFLDSLSKRGGEIREHSGYHEQASAFAAHGYALAGGNLGVAYATKGPGMLNLVTGIAAAFHESASTLFIVGHSEASPKSRRFDGKQDVDAAKVVQAIVKYYARVENAEDIPAELSKAYRLATTGRKGPVLLDIKASVFRAEIDPKNERDYAQNEERVDFDASKILTALSNAKRPTILIGNGVFGSKQGKNIAALINNLGVPALSSKTSMDILLGLALYYGHIGSHGLTQAHFILSKADLVLSLGNRLSYPAASKTWEDFFNLPHVIRIDIDEAELERQTAKKETKIKADLAVCVPRLLELSVGFNRDIFASWRDVCDKISSSLEPFENEYPTTANRRILSTPNSIVTIDAGENEIWAISALVNNPSIDRALFAGNLEAVGSALPTAIGAFYALRRPVYAIMGDHGFGFNMQELQFIKNEKIPIILIINNNGSMGALRTEQQGKFDGKVYHTTRKSGYTPMNIAKIAAAFEFDYINIDSATDLSKLTIIQNKPLIIEVVAPEDLAPKHRLPFGNKMQDFAPQIDRKLYEELDRL